MNSAINIAKYVINKCNELSNPISNLQLQKILYYIQGNYYAKFNEKLFREDIEAWKYGPVIPEVYYEFNKYSSGNIRDEFEVDYLEIDSERLDYIDNIIQSNCKLTAWQLVEKSHKEDPWRLHYDRSFNKVIPSKIIKEFFITQQD